MTEVVITVQGRYSARRSAERATLRMAVSAEDAERSRAMTAVVDSAASVRVLLTGEQDAVVSWWSDDVRTWAERPWNHDGRAIEPVFHAHIDLIAVFADFGRLARVVDEAAVLPGVSIHGIEWTLTDESTATVHDEVRRKAVTDATAKATVYAAAVGCATIVPVAVADAGMLDGSASGGGGAPIAVMRSTLAAASESAGVSLTPQPIEVDAIVDARFIAS